MNNATEPVVVRAFCGYLVDGREIGIRLVPSSSTGRIGVDVIAHPAVTGFSQSCRLGGDGPSEFGLGGIKVQPARLDCMATDDVVPFYRQGFSVVLEVGMADKILPILQPLARVAVVSAAIARRMDALKLSRAPDRGSWAHAHDFAADVVASIVLDGLSPDQAHELHAAQHWAGKDEEFMADFADGQVQCLLYTARIPATPPTHSCKVES